MRQYTDKDIEELRYIYNLVKVRGFKIAAARKMISSNRNGVNKSTKVLEQLVSVKNQLQELKDALEKIVKPRPRPFPIEERQVRDTNKSS